jgi:biopolymer transport protein ExbD
MATSMFAGDSGASRGVMAEMNITPLVDVMLVLLVIFMIAAPMVTRSIDIRLPQGAPPGPQVVKPPHLSLRVLGDGQFTLQGAALSEAGLASALTDAARRAPDTIVDVAVSENADYQAFTTALATARRSGISNIALQ